MNPETINKPFERNPNKNLTRIKEIINRRNQIWVHRISYKDKITSIRDTATKKWRKRKTPSTKMNLNISILSPKYKQTKKIKLKGIRSLLVHKNFAKTLMTSWLNHLIQFHKEHTIPRKSLSKMLMTMVEHRVRWNSNIRRILTTLPKCATRSKLTNQLPPRWSQNTNSTS